MKLSTVATIGVATGGALLKAVHGMPPETTVGILGTVAAAELIAGVGADLWAAAIDRGVDARRATRDLLVNEDLVRATATALQQRLTEAAEKMTEASQSADRGRLKRIAEDAPRWWTDIACEQAGNEFDSLREGALVDGLTLLLSNLEQQRSDYVPPQPITQEIWDDLLRRLDQELGGEGRLSEAAVHAVAGVLQEHVLKDIYLVVKHDLEHGGRAYAALSLRFMAEILAQGRSLKEDLNRLPAVVRSELEAFFLAQGEQLPTTLYQLQKALAGLVELKALPENVRTALRETELRVRDDLARSGDRIIREQGRNGR